MDNEVNKESDLPETLRRRVRRVFWVKENDSCVDPVQGSGETSLVAGVDSNPGNEKSESRH